MMMRHIIHKGRLISRAILILAGLVAAVSLVTGCDRPPPPGQVDVVQALSEKEDLSCYAQADRPSPIVFPKDLGPHDNFKTEWWYYTGNLTTDSGRAFGFQLTFFRQALSCDVQKEGSPWRTRQLFLAHFAVTDGDRNRFYAAQRMTRGSIGLAGAQSDPFHVWLDNWSAAGAGKEALRLKARDHMAAKGEMQKQAVGIDLTLTRTKPVILQGNEGWSSKGPDTADASYYYSFPGLAARGHLRIGDSEIPVKGRAWFDHEWSTAALGKAALGWDWIALHLTAGPHAGTDLMVCRVRQVSGPDVTFASLSLPDGRTVILDGKRFSMTPTGSWTSPASGKTYPDRWQVRLKDLGLDLTVVPVIPDQEHTGGLVYYEGAVTVVAPPGSKDTERPLLGRGYVEMTGY